MCSLKEWKYVLKSWPIVVCDFYFVHAGLHVQSRNDRRRWAQLVQRPLGVEALPSRRRRNKGGQGGAVKPHYGGQLRAGEGGGLRVGQDQDRGVYGGTQWLCLCFRS